MVLFLIPQNYSQQFCTFLVKRNTLRVLDVDGTTSARRLLEIKHWRMSEDVGNDERRTKEEEDKAGSVIEDVVRHGKTERKVFKVTKHVSSP